MRVGVRTRGVRLSPMKALLSSLLAFVAVSAACERECPEVEPAKRCEEPVVASAADAAVAPSTGSLYRDTLELVRLAYGDSHDLYVRALEFKTECLSTSLMQRAVRLVPEYNAFDGAKIAEAIEKLRGEIMCWQFGREGSPVIYMQIPYWLSQSERACPDLHDKEGAQLCEKAADDRRLTQAETADLTKRATALFQSLHADEMAFDPIAKNTMRIWWD